MRMYTVYIADELTKFPLAIVYHISARSEEQAKQKVFKDVLEKDTSYTLTAKLED